MEAAFGYTRATPKIKRTSDVIVETVWSYTPQLLLLSSAAAKNDCRELNPQAVAYTYVGGLYPLLLPSPELRSKFIRMIFQATRRVALPLFFVFVVSLLHSRSPRGVRGGLLAVSNRFSE